MQTDDTQINYFYSRIAKAIKDNGWTQYKLAQEAGIPKSTINSMIDKKSEPKMINLVKICGACKI